MTTRKSSRFLPAPIRTAVRAELAELRKQNGGLTDPLIREKAESLRVSPRTVWRLAAVLGEDGKPRRREPFALTNDHLAVVAASPNLKAAWQSLRAAGQPVPGYVQWTRACGDVDPAVLAGIRDGRTALHEKQAYLLVDAEHRGDVWWIDHYYVPVKVRWPGYRNPVTPIQTTLMDDVGRFVIATVLWPKPPTDTEAVAAVARAIFGFVDPTGVRHGGTPRTLRMDNGSELIGSTMTQQLIGLRVTPEPVRARGAWEKGKLERWHRTLGTECYAAEAGWTGGPRDYENRPMLTVPTDELLTAAQLRAHLDAWVAFYNFERGHDALDGKTPYQVWTAEGSPLRALPNPLLRTAMLSVERKVRKEGVRLGDVAYFHPLFTKNRDRLVEVRYLPDEPSFVDVELPDGGWVRAVPHKDLTAEAKDELMRLRAGQERTVTATTKQAKSLRKTRASERAAADATQAAAEDSTAGADTAPTTSARVTAGSNGHGPVPPVPVGADGLGATVDVMLANPPKQKRQRTP